MTAGERPPTPGAPPLPDADGQHAALVLLQRLLRGRAVQNEMYAGKMARLQLVRELRLGLEGIAGGCGAIFSISVCALFWLPMLACRSVLLQANPATAAASDLSQSFALQSWIQLTGFVLA
jgi:hypothetical protein